MAHQNDALNSTLRDEETVSSLLKSKRKARAVKSCFPCRHRRVRCDGGSPCSSCLARGHAELCQRQAGISAAAPAQPSAPTESADADRAGLLLGGIGKEQQQQEEDPDLVIKRLEQIEEQISSIKADLKRKAQSQAQETAAAHRDSVRGPTKAAGQHFIERDTGATIFLGSHADPPTALGLMPLFGPSSAFDGLAPRTYAFANLWTPEIDIEEVCKTLPEDRDIIRYWQIYQACVYPYYPALVSLDEFSVSLFAFLDCNTEARAKTVSTWLGLLFALLACGAQFSDDPVEERELRSKVFVCSSFQCLRISNLFSNTDMNTIQALALIGHCLRNNLDTNTAWIVMGLTIRLAQSIGLHEEARSAESPGPAVKRKRLWWMLLWQDAFLSFTYDRPPSTSVETIAIPYESTEGYSFADATLTVIQIILDRSREESSQLNTQPRFEHYTHRLAGIQEDSAPFLKDKANCKSLQEHLERLALQIHVGYARCRIYRLYLENNNLDPATRESRTLEYSAHAATVVQSFLDMHRLSANACRASAFIHNVVSSAVALKDLMSRSRPSSPAPAWDANFEQCTQRLIKVLEREQEKSEWTDSDTNVRRFGPYSRALLALKETFGLPQQSV
ncbi:hypothetical protein PFICI_08772 [Pestalotiopsis fici W106-1]|uniref:Zn(2)-C6 fungal-type domain-containing protein n=1 Tax=Pestalotiopsis fici (strain W106-1 / CGMCC3.15140) TaxID=1229662 RepID=W3WYR0_PESFW|nr:uncharacterized protein PFICI_08772 [Pestalotiopsis fici W106-1]ETS78919.1 hypothetical protein PFICI_08772 [Pestalotiopsis fici W106-1]